MKKYNKHNETSYTLGISLTLFLLEEKTKYVKNVYFHSSIEKNDAYYKIIKICNKEKIPYQENNKIFNIMANKENCFVIGEFLKYDAPITDGNHIVLVNPSNAGNLGTIIRSMVGFNIKNLVIILPAVDIYDPKVIRASMGAFFKINFKLYDSFVNYLKDHQHQQLVSFMLQTNTSLEDYHFEKPFSLIFGNEATGLPEEFLNICNPVRIMHSQEIDSLNLPIAATIAMYEATKNDFKRSK